METTLETNRSTTLFVDLSFNLLLRFAFNEVPHFNQHTKFSIKHFVEITRIVLTRIKEYLLI